jgi:hypothetical protein
MSGPEDGVETALEHEGVKDTDFPTFSSQRPRGEVPWVVCFENMLKASLSIPARVHHKAEFLIV